MTIIEHSPSATEILDFIHSQLLNYRHDGVEARYIVVGRDAYERLCSAISVAMVRGKGRFEMYSGVPIVLDPFRVDQVCVVPGPGECAKGVDTYQT